PQPVELAAPGRGAPADDPAARSPLTGAGRLAEVHLVVEAGARIAAGVADERPAQGLRADAVVMDVLLDFVRVAPDVLGLEAAVPLVEARELDTRDPFQRVEHRAGAETLERRRPVGARAQVHGVVVAVRVAEAQQQPP